MDRDVKGLDWPRPSHNLVGLQDGGTKMDWAFHDMGCISFCFYLYSFRSCENYVLSVCIAIFSAFSWAYYQGLVNHILCQFQTLGCAKSSLVQFMVLKYVECCKVLNEFEQSSDAMTAAHGIYRTVS